MVYKATFEDYAISFPSQIEKLKNNSKHEVSIFLGDGKGTKTILQELDIPIDFKGLYCFWLDDKPVYVGISRNVINRLFQHIKGTTYHSATLPIKILKTDFKEQYESLSRKSFNSDILRKSQSTHLHKMKVSFVQIEDDIELYLFEAYCAVTFQCRYNSFKTH